MQNYDNFVLKQCPSAARAGPIVWQDAGPSVANWKKGRDAPAKRMRAPGS